MIPLGARVWFALGHTDMRKGMQGLALMVQQGLKRNPHGGDLFVFRGRAGSLIKTIWHNRIGMAPLPDDVDALKALVATMAHRADEAEQNAATATAKLANAMAHQSVIEALISHLKLQIAKLRREQFGPSAERSRRLLDKMELQLEELEADAAEDDLIAEQAAAKTTTVTAFEHKRPARKPYREHLPRERVVVAAPCSCTACGGDGSPSSARTLPRRSRSSHAPGR